ncbi:MAG: ribosome small subunit-dependent GTPase A [Bacteroidetes bacterium]|jgi:ribosome biogenesis GTPase|nr:ribosome small subunit-dependent GTPase A [Bacteroidota bacterium]
MDIAGDYSEGVVIRSTGSWYEVQVEDNVIASTIRGKFRLEMEDAALTNPVAVGDHVTIQHLKDGTGVIEEVHPRETMLCRRAAGRRVGMAQIIAANIDFVWIVQSVRLPTPTLGFIDRVLVMCERYELDAGIILNKMDLLRPKDEARIENIAAIYGAMGYELMFTSAEQQRGLEALTEHLSDRVSVVTGPSGVGKTTLLNALEPGLDLRTGEVSEKNQKGRHTTTYAARYELSSGGAIVDTPGIREFGVVEMEAWELAHYFREFQPYIHDCRFPNCTHDHEPDCAVRDAADAGHIPEARYISYLKILDSIQLGDADVGR